MTPLTQWLQSMRYIWLNKRPDDIETLLSDTLEYYEDPLLPPLTSKKDVITAWQEILQQTIEYIEIDIIYESDDGTGVVLWTFKEIDKPEHKGIYFIQLNPHGKCYHFRQFWSVKR